MRGQGSDADVLEVTECVSVCVRCVCVGGGLSGNNCLETVQK